MSERDGPPLPSRTVSPLSELSDEQLLERHLAGQSEAFRVLVERYRVELFRFLGRFLGDRSLADDVFQDTFVQVYQSANHFDPARRFRPWLFAIATNKARDALRTGARRHAASLDSHDDAPDSAPLHLLVSAEQPPDEPVAAQEIRERVKKVVTTLPTQYREILLLAYFNQFSYKHISEILQVPVGTVKSRLHAAVAFFAQQWKETNPDRWAS